MACYRLCWAWTGQSHAWGFPNSPSHSNAPQENLIRRRDRRKITSVIVQMGIVCFSPFYSRNMTSCKCSSFKGIFVKVVAPGIPQAIWSSGEWKRQRHYYSLLTLSSFNYQLCRIRWRKNESNMMADSNHQHLQLSRERALDIQDAIVTSLGFGVMMQL